MAGDGLTGGSFTQQAGGQGAFQICPGIFVLHQLSGLSVAAEAHPDDGKFHTGGSHLLPVDLPLMLRYVHTQHTGGGEAGQIAVFVHGKIRRHIAVGRRRKGIVGLPGLGGDSGGGRLRFLCPLHHRGAHQHKHKGQHRGKKGCRSGDMYGVVFHVPPALF